MGISAAVARALSSEHLVGAMEVLTGLAVEVHTTATHTHQASTHGLRGEGGAPEELVIGGGGGHEGGAAAIAGGGEVHEGVAFAQIGVLGHIHRHKQI